MPNNKKLQIYKLLITCKVTTVLCECNWLLRRLQVNIQVFKIINNHETSLKTGFAQIFSCCPKKLNCPKLGGGGLHLPPPPGPYAYDGDSSNHSLRSMAVLVGRAGLDKTAMLRRLLQSQLCFYRCPICKWQNNQNHRVKTSNQSE